METEGERERAECGSILIYDELWLWLGLSFGPRRNEAGFHPGVPERGYGMGECESGRG
jgi:hypothetical protein